MSSSADLRPYGLLELGTLHHNLSPAVLIEMAIRRNEAQLTESGALTAITGKRTGRFPRINSSFENRPSSPVSIRAG